MIQIRCEVEDIITGKQPKDNNLLKNAPHPISVIASSEWNQFGALSEESTLLLIDRPLSPYSRQTAVYPLPWLLEKKFWPTVSRVDDGTPAHLRWHYSVLIFSSSIRGSQFDRKSFRMVCSARR